MYVPAQVFTSPVLGEGRIILLKEMWRWWGTRGKSDWGEGNKVAASKGADAASKRKTCQAVNSLMRHSIFGNAAGAPLQYGPSAFVHGRAHLLAS